MYQKYVDSRKTRSELLDEECMQRSLILQVLPRIHLQKGILSMCASLSLILQMSKPLKIQIKVVPLPHRMHLAIPAILCFEESEKF